MEDSPQCVTQLTQLLPRLQHPQSRVGVKGCVAAGDEQGDTAHSHRSIAPAKPTHVGRSGMEPDDGCAWGRVRDGQFALAGKLGLEVSAG